MRLYLITHIYLLWKIFRGGIRNICWKCEHWKECFKYRYGNRKQEYMTKIRRSNDELGQPVIYVQECSKFSYEFQKDMPKLNQKHIQDYIKRKNAKKLKNCIIIIYRRTIFMWNYSGKEIQDFMEGKVSIF